MAETFTTTVLKAGLNAAGIEVPANVIAALGSTKKPPVIVRLAGYSYRSTVAVMDGAFMIPLSQEHRAAAGVNAGDTLEVTLELDSEPRTVEVPDDLAAALSVKPGARAAFDGQAFSKRKEFVRQVEEAKTAETRERRITKIVAQLGN